MLPVQGSLLCFASFFMSTRQKNDSHGDHTFLTDQSPGREIQATHLIVPFTAPSSYILQDHLLLVVLTALWLFPESYSYISPVIFYKGNLFVRTSDDIHRPLYFLQHVNTFLIMKNPVTAMGFFLSVFEVSFYFGTWKKSLLTLPFFTQIQSTSVLDS